MAKSTNLLRAYLIVGADALKRDTALSRLKGYLDDVCKDFNLDERDASSIKEPEDLISTVSTMPFMSPFRLVIIRNAAQLTRPVSEAIVSYLASPNPSTVLCLEAEKLAKNTRLYKAIQGQGAKAVISCNLPKRSELPKYVQRLAQAHKLRLDRDAADELIVRVGDATVQLDNQLRSLKAQLGEVVHVHLEDVQNYVPQIAEISPWVFLDALSRRNATQALRMYRRMQDPSSVFLCSIMHTRVRELICAKALDERGNPYQLAGELGKQDWQVKHYIDWSRRFTMRELTDLLREGCKLSRAIRSSQDHESAFLTYILKFSG